MVDSRANQFTAKPKKNTPRDRGLVLVQGLTQVCITLEPVLTSKQKHALGTLPEHQHNKPAYEQGARRADHYQSHVL